MNPYKFINLLALFSLASGLFAKETTVKDFSWAYSQDEYWPSHVTPKEAITDASGAILLQENIPVVLMRAYEDGQLSVVDRAGNLLIDHSKTDFLEQIEKTLASAHKVKTRILLHQLGRRTIDLSYSQSKAVSETEFSKYSKFLIIRTSSMEEPLLLTLSVLNDRQAHFERENIRPILIFDELMPNQQFYELVKRHEIPYPIITPIFQKGLLDALFSERESGYRSLLLSISGKLIEKKSSIVNNRT